LVLICLLFVKTKYFQTCTVCYTHSRNFGSKVGNNGVKMVNLT